jgi:hypothetical protein
MEKIRPYLILLGIISAFLLYSFFNYSLRRKAVNKVENYSKEAGLTKIFYLREMHLNPFDFVIEDKTQNSFIFVDKSSIKLNDTNNYYVSFSNWKEPENDETLTNYTLKRENNIFKITFHNSTMKQIDKDSILSSEIEGKIFEVVDNWIKNDYKIK